MSGPTGQVSGPAGPVLPLPPPATRKNRRIMNQVRPLPIVALIGSGDPDHGNSGLSEAIGHLIAEMGFHLLTGGGRGVMADASRGFTSIPDRAGLSLGIIPRSATGDEEGEKWDLGAVREFLA